MTYDANKEKHRVFQEILVALGIRVEDTYFSEGSTITLDGIRAVHTEVMRRDGVVQSIKKQIKDVQEDMLSL